MAVTAQVRAPEVDATIAELKRLYGDRVTTAVIPNASHALIPEQPQAVVAALTAWIKTLP